MNALLEVTDILTPDQVEGREVVFDETDVDGIKKLTSRVVALSQQSVDDDKEIQSPNPKITPDIFRAVLAQYLTGDDVADFHKSLQPYLDDMEGKEYVEPRVLREISHVLNRRKGVSAETGLKCRAVLNVLHNYDSVCIAEDKIFSKRYILELIVRFALSRKMNVDKAKITKIRRNKNGDLLVIEVEIPDPNGGDRFIEYCIKGRHVGNESSVSILSWGGMGEIATYVNGKWVFTA